MIDSRDTSHATAGGPPLPSGGGPLYVYFVRVRIRERPGAPRNSKRVHRYSGGYRLEMGGPRGPPSSSSFASRCLQLLS